MLEPIYLNVLLLNKDEVVSKKVAEKTGLTAGIASYAANKAVSDETVTSGLSSNLKGKITISNVESVYFNDNCASNRKDRDICW